MYDNELENKKYNK